MTMRPSLIPLLGANKVIPVLTLASAEQGLAVAGALAAGGVTVVEVTLRTSAGLEAIRALRSALPHVLVGAGTILEARQLDQAVEAGAQFIVTPGTTAALRKALDAHPALPCLPGAATVSEMLTLREAGFRELKFFPAGSSGGVDHLRSVAGPCPDLKFCPTGGVGPANLRDWLALPNVFAAGGSWLTPAAALAAGDMATVTRLARESAV